VFSEMDNGDQAEMTLEDGRRHLFWDKDYQIQWEWASEQRRVPCQSPANPDATLINTGLSLKTNIKPDETNGAHLVRVHFTRIAPGIFEIHGTNDIATGFVVEGTANLTQPIIWQPLQTNTLSAGPFSFPIAREGEQAALFRVRVQ
jgi:hypothetical protein